MTRTDVKEVREDLRKALDILYTLCRRSSDNIDDRVFNTIWEARAKLNEADDYLSIIHAKERRA